MVKPNNALHPTGYGLACVVGVSSVELVPCVGPAPHLPCSSIAA
jgi:hypothetical protein